MDEVDYDSFVKDAINGHILLGVDRGYARWLYTEVPISEIKQKTGEAVYLEKMVVLFALVAAPISLMVTFVLSCFAFRWWACLLIPISFLIWFFNGSNSKIWFLSFLLVVATAMHFMKYLPNEWMSGYFLAFILSFWFDRLLYWAASAFLRAFVIRNRRAFEAFAEGITIKRVEMK